MAICVIWRLIWENGKRNAKNAADYEDYYAQIKYNLKNRGGSKHDKDVIHYMIVKLSKMKHKNQEKTSVLKDNFYWKFRAIRASKEN